MVIGAMGSLIVDLSVLAVISQNYPWPDVGVVITGCNCLLDPSTGKCFFPAGKMHHINVLYFTRAVETVTEPMLVFLT